jgi:hypothetical protein
MLPLRVDVQVFGMSLAAECFLAPYHSSIGIFSFSGWSRRHEIQLRSQRSAATKARKDHGDDAVHGEEGGVEAAQVARGNEECS